MKTKPGIQPKKIAFRQDSLRPRPLTMEKRSILLIALLVVFSSMTVRADQDRRPNILWFVVDDMSADFSCYGETTVQTPAVDSLAKEGVMFTDAHVTAPVCSTCRSAFMTGMYQTSIGSHHHRSGRGKARIRLPGSITPVPVLFQNAGYYTCNGNGLPDFREFKPRNKTDYNFEWDKAMYDSTDWNGRKPGQPFFMQIQLAGGKLRGSNSRSYEKVRQKAQTAFGDTVDPDKVQLPSYYPDDPVLREDWAAYLDSVRLTDRHVGLVLERLKNEGIYKNTLIIFMTDHGISHARGKQFLYKEGTHIPLVIRGPGISGGTTRKDPVVHIDMTALSLAAAGIPLPSGMEGRDILADDYLPRSVVFTSRDRCDETVEFMRSARSGDLLYIRNYHCFRPHLQPSRYKDGKDIVKRLRILNAEDRMNMDQKRILFSRVRKGEELYDLRNDPFEMKNLVDNPSYVQELNHLREQLDNHLISSRDAGFIPEPLLSDIAMDPSSTIYDFIRSDSNYPLPAILTMANLAIERKVENIPEFRKALNHNNPVIRYWALTGLRILETASVSVQVEVEKKVQDPDASVRMAAASILANLGRKKEAADLFLAEARKAVTDAHALWALDGIKFMDTPGVIKTIPESELVKGDFSKRNYDFLINGGLVYPEK